MEMLSNSKAAVMVPRMIVRGIPIASKRPGITVSFSNLRRLMREASVNNSSASVISAINRIVSL